MKKALIIFATFAVMGTGVFSSATLSAADFEYSVPLEVGFNTNNNDLKFRGFEQDKLDDRSHRVSCTGYCDDRRTTILFMQQQTISNLPLITGSTERVGSSNIQNQSIAVSNESSNSEVVTNAQ